MNGISCVFITAILLVLNFSFHIVSAAPDVSDKFTPDVSNRESSLLNPLAFNTIEEFLGALLDVLVIFAVPVIIFFIIYAGFTYVTAQGSEEKVSKAHRMLLYALVGGLLILGAKGLIAVIESTAKPFLR